MASGPDSNRKKMLKFFDDADSDGNGYLSPKELKAALKKQGYNLSQSKLKKQFAQFDLDGDNRVSRDEFLVCMGELPSDVHNGAMIRKMFYSFDKNHDGYIDQNEIKQVFREMRRRNMTDEDLENLMKLVDTDGDGKIQYEEFVKFFEKKIKT